MNEEQILCACSAYEQKYYFNPRISGTAYGNSGRTEDHGGDADGRCRRGVYHGI